MTRSSIKLFYFLVSPIYAISDVKGTVIIPIDQKRSMLCEKGLVGQCTTTKDQQCGQIHCGELKCQRVKDSELRSTEIEKCFATLNGSIARPSLNFRLESYIGAGEEKQWKLVFSSFSSSLPLKQRAASFKGDILDPGFASLYLHQIIKSAHVCSIKSKLLWESGGETEAEGERSILYFLNFSPIIEQILKLARFIGS